MDTESPFAVSTIHDATKMPHGHITYIEVCLGETTKMPGSVLPSTFGSNTITAPSAFGNTTMISAFGTTSTPSAFGKPAFSQPQPQQTSTSVFGQPAQRAPTSAFGQTSRPLRRLLNLQLRGCLVRFLGHPVRSSLLLTVLRRRHLLPQEAAAVVGFRLSLGQPSAFWTWRRLDE